MFPSNIKNIFKLLLANFLVFFVIAFVVEICGQVYAYFHPAYKVIPFAPHPILGWSFIPNTEHIITGNHWYAREFSAKVKINSHGFRDFERTIKKDKDTIRIALLGDSMIAARQLDFEKTAGQLLEKRLERDFSSKTGKRYEVLNFGVPGYGVDQMFLNWNIYASKFDPDFVFLYIFERNYLRTISESWCKRDFMGIHDLTQRKCLAIRPIAIVKQGLPNEISSMEAKNIIQDYIYISSLDLNRVIKKNENIVQKLSHLPLQILDPANYKLFVKQQNDFLNIEMKGKRMIKKKTKWFLYDIFLHFNKVTGSFFEKKELESWKKLSFYTSGDKDNYPSWLTTNLVNLKTLQVLGGKIIKSKRNFVVIDSFQFHSRSIPPTQFASKWLKNLSKYSGFGYIPLYEKLNESMKEGNPPVWKYDSHLNKLGNEIFAKSMFDYLKTRFN